MQGIQYSSKHSFGNCSYSVVSGDIFKSTSECLKRFLQRLHQVFSKYWFRQSTKDSINDISENSPGRSSKVFLRKNHYKEISNDSFETRYSFKKVHRSSARVRVVLLEFLQSLLHGFYQEIFSSKYSINDFSTKVKHFLHNSFGDFFEDLSWHFLKR